MLLQHVILPVSVLSVTALASKTTPNSSKATTTDDYAARCYSATLSSLPISTLSAVPRATPWGHPTYKQPNGTLCCNSLDQVRDGIDAVDEQLLLLLAQRAAYVREATRFKSTVEDVNDPKRDKQVIAGAVKSGRVLVPQVPVTVARAVFEG